MSVPNRRQACVWGAGTWGTGNCTAPSRPFSYILQYSSASSHAPHNVLIPSEQFPCNLPYILVHCLRRMGNLHYESFLLLGSTMSMLLLRESDSVKRTGEAAQRLWREVCKGLPGGCVAVLESALDQLRARRHHPLSSMRERDDMPCMGCFCECRLPSACTWPAFHDSFLLRLPSRTCIGIGER